MNEKSETGLRRKYEGGGPARRSPLGRRRENQGKPVFPAPFLFLPSFRQAQKPGQTGHTAVVSRSGGQIACKHFKMNGLQNKSCSARSNPVKPGQTDLKHFFEKAADQIHSG
jgi:hypothetical protein